MRFALILALLSTTGAAAPAPRKVYVGRWQSSSESAEGRALIAQADRQLRDELQRRGASVVESARAAIVLKPRLEIFPRARKLNVIGVRDQRLLGTISMKAAGSSRDAQLKAIVSRACAEADSFD